MELSPILILIVIASAVASFAFGRWISRGWRQRKAERERLARQATESRQVRRQRERRERR